MIHRAGSEFVNWYLLEDGGKVTIVDCGLRGYRAQLEPALASIGRTIDDVEAIVLTHGDADHVGFAAQLQQERGLPVFAHTDDLPLVRDGKAKKTEIGPGAVLGALRHGFLRRLLGHFLRNGGARPPKVADVTTYVDGEELDVPGRPRVVLTPGHTNGHCALHVASENAVFVGDALNGVALLTGEPGVRLPPPMMNVSTATALTSLGRLERLDAATVYFGHGDPHAGGIAAAVAEARSRR